MKPDSRNPLGECQVGYVFFTHSPGLVSLGIDYFERWPPAAPAGWPLPPEGGAPKGCGPAGLHVSHTGIVVGPGGGIVEAHWQHGVQTSHLSKYYNDPKTVVLFRRPRGWTPALGGRIASAALRKVGCPYNKGLILSQLAANTLLGHFLNRLFHGAPDRWVSARLDRKQEFICSELSSFALNEQPEFRGKGVLSEPLNTISPQELFEDSFLWEAPAVRPSARAERGAPPFERGAWERGSVGK